MENSKNAEVLTGEAFLKKHDKKHRELLRDFNKLIDNFVRLEDSQHFNKLKIDECKPKITALRQLDTGKKNNKPNHAIKLSELNNERLVKEKKQVEKSKQSMLRNKPLIKNNKQKIKQYSEEHYNTVIARMQAGIPYAIWKAMMETSDSIQNNKVMKVIKNSGMIVSRYNNEVYLINPYDTEKKTLKLILNEVKGTLEVVSVIAHGKTQYNSTLKEWIKGDFNNKLYLCPYNDNLLSWISSRQTEAVEKCCQVVNYFTETFSKNNKQKLKVYLRGESQGLDFITKMVGSTHGKNDTRLKNTNIKLNITAPHRWQDEQKIVNRLINGAKNNNTITTIHINNAMGGCIHPTYKTDNLIRQLESYKKKFNKNVTIKSLQTLSSDQQHTFN